jgi:hypothetical protein
VLVEDAGTITGANIWMSVTSTTDVRLMATMLASWCPPKMTPARTAHRQPARSGHRPVRRPYPTTRTARTAAPIHARQNASTGPGASVPAMITLPVAKSTAPRVIRATPLRWAAACTLDPATAQVQHVAGDRPQDFDRPLVQEA